MIIDALIGMFLVLAGLVLGYENNSFFLLGFAYVVDLDIVIHEFIRVAKKEKRFLPKNFLDELSYQHKFILHHPISVIIGTILTGILVDWIYGILVFLALTAHLVHDTVDKNFDGVRWVYPVNKISYKLRLKKGKFILIKLTPEQLYAIAQKKMDKSRTTSQILKSNL